MVVACYISGAALAAWLATGNGHLDWKMSILVLPLMYLAHLGRKGMAGKRETRRSGTSQYHACLACRTEIGMFRRLKRVRFCCDDHERTYLTELEELAIQRLRNAHIDVPARCSNAEIIDLSDDHSNLIEHQAATPVGGHEQALSLILRPKEGGFRRSPAYHAAMSS